MPNFQTAANPARLVDYMVNHYWQDQGTPDVRPQTGAGNTVTVNLSALNARGATAARAALEAWEMVANVNFREVQSGGAISFDDVGDQATTEIRFGGSGQVTSIRVNIGDGWLDRYDSIVGSFGLMTYVHEIGHALGLGHPGDYNFAGPTWPDGVQSNLDSYQYTLMSYYGQDENPNTGATRASAITPQLADILAIQQIYGVRSGGVTAGDTVWGRGATLDNYLGHYQRDSYQTGQVLPYGTTFTIWDEGGEDLVDLGHHGRDQVVNLAPGGISSVLGLIGNMIIARGTVIEHYTAGYGHDRVNGNTADNRILAGGGNDTVWGNGGNDTLRGDNGDDLLRGGGGNDSLFGDNNADRLYGDAGNDRLSGGLGDDRLDGGLGNDTLRGDEGADLLRGGAGHDRLWGGTLDDRLYGGGGQDSLYGDTGNDRLWGDKGNDRLEGADAHDQLYGGAGQDSLFGGAGTDTLDGGAGDDMLDGGAAQDILRGGLGRDRLDGGEGSDTLTGGAGDDVFVFNGGRDRITDFAAGDQIVLDAALWGGTAPDRAAVLDSVDDTPAGLELVINFQTRLLLEGVHDQALFGDSFSFC